MRIEAVIALSRKRLLAVTMTIELRFGLWIHIMNISKSERRALEMLSFGGTVRIEKNGKRVISADFVNRDGWFLDGYGVSEFDQLRKKKMIASRNGAAYTITKVGVVALSLTRQAK